MNPTQTKIIDYLNSCIAHRSSLRAIVSSMDQNYKYVANQCSLLFKAGELTKLKDKKTIWYCLPESEEEPKPLEVPLPVWRAKNPMQMGMANGEWDFSFGTSPHVFNKKSPLPAEYGSGLHGKPPKPPNRCAWTIRYGINGFKHPDEMIGPVERLSQAQLAAEANDVLHMRFGSLIGPGHQVEQGNPQLSSLARLLQIKRPWDVTTRREVENCLRSLRPHYPEVLAPWCLEPIILVEEDIRRGFPDWNPGPDYKPAKKPGYIVLISMGATDFYGSPANHRKGWLPYEVGKIIVTTSKALKRVEDWSSILWNEQWPK